VKMPRRTWYPSMQSRPDIFGLHHVTIIGRACESDVERRQRVAKVEAGVKAAFKAAIHHLGEDDGRELFARVLRRPKRGPGKALATDRDARLLKAFDVAPKGQSIAGIARGLRAQGTDLGNTAGAIAKQIRKLLEERKEREHRKRVEARRWRMAMRNEPPTLLETAVSASRKREK
jgi:hypothetical protein